MKFLRNSLTKKALILFTLITGGLVISAIWLIRQGKFEVSIYWLFGGLIALITLILSLFLWDVVWPIHRVVKQIKNLLTGHEYERIEPITVDEVGIFTHFFNEITHDLEKISYDVKERRRMSSELDIAANIQKDVLPKEAPNASGLDIVAKTRSAAEVGGDSFDFLSSPDASQVFIYIGDVTGHGVPAGLVMVMVDTLIHSMVSNGLKNSKDVIVGTNNLLTPRINARLFMTLVMLRWDIQNQKMYYTGAGHEHILLYKANEGTVDAFRSGGIALGMIPDNSKVIEEKEIPLEIGDVVVLYTDGLTEAKNQAGEMYEIEKMTNSLKKHGYLPSSESIFKHLTDDFAQFVGEYVQADDTTMIVIKYVGAGQASQTKLTIANDNQQKKQESKIWSWD